MSNNNCVLLTIGMHTPANDADQPVNPRRLVGVCDKLCFDRMPF